MLSCAIQLPRDGFSSQLKPELRKREKIPLMWC